MGKPVVSRFLRGALLLGACLAFADCAEQGALTAASHAIAENAAYKDAREADTSTAWRNYIQQYPEDHVGEARRKLAEALWRDAKGLNAASAYIQFIQENPDSPRADEARAQARRLLAAGQGTEKDYDDFLSLPGKGRIADVLRGLEDIRRQAALKADSKDAYEIFAAQYPRSQGTTDVRALLIKQEFADAKALGTRLSLGFFARRFHDSSQAAQARALLDKLPPAEDVGDAGAFIGELPKMRKASRALRWRECFESLARREKAVVNPYGRKAENIRGLLRDLAATNAEPDDVCARSPAVPASRRALVAKAIRAMTLLAQRQSEIAELSAAPDAIAQKALDLQSQAAALRDKAESTDLEMQAFVGYSPADPEDPKAVASKIAREAMRRIKGVAQSAGGASASSAEEAESLLDLMARQQALLIEIIASNESDGAVQAAREGE